MFLFLIQIQAHKFFLNQMDFLLRLDQAPLQFVIGLFQLAIDGV